MMWTASFDERLQLNLLAARGLDIIPDGVLDLLTHPIHQDEPEHWVPVSQHYACPRTIQKHDTTARCGTISRAVTGYLYTNHETGRKNRHTCIACGHQWQRSGLCYATVITNYKHTLQVYMTSPADQLRHKRETWVSKYLATYEPLLPYRDTPPYHSDPDHTTRLELGPDDSKRLWEILYQPLTPLATKHLLHIQSTRLRNTTTEGP